MFQKFTKNYQAVHVANNWLQTIKNREMVKNNFRTTGDIKKAKVFVNTVTMYQPHTHFADHGEHIIFSFGDLALAPEPVYTI